jgi:hypothetical protein
MNTGFDHLLRDAQAMTIDPVEPADFEFDRFEAHALEADQRYAEFLQQPEGVAVWQRVRVAEVFLDGCSDYRQSLRLQLGALAKSLDYRTDAPAYLEPWYGIGIAASAFGGNYDWPPGQAPVLRSVYRSLDEIPDALARAPRDVPITANVLAMIEYFLEETGGRVPLSWTDTQSPLNVATGLVDVNALLLGLLEDADKVRALMSAVADEVVAFTKMQSELIGAALVRPGHGFASSRAGRGIGMSCDNTLMISPHMYEVLCAPLEAAIGNEFGGSAFHSCGNWARWAPAVKTNNSLFMVDGAFTPQTDPDPNPCSVFRDLFANTGIVVQARMVGDPDAVLETARRLWAPGMKLLIVTYVEDVASQHRLYQDFHHICQ